MKNSREIKDGSLLYIATDERDKSFFKPFKEKHDVAFLDDFKHLLKGINTNYYGMLDQLVASKGRVFYGTWWSTLSGYVNRMRGYYITKHKLEGHEDGTMESYYFFPLDRGEFHAKHLRNARLNSFHSTSPLQTLTCTFNLLSHKRIK